MGSTRRVKLRGTSMIIDGWARLGESSYGERLFGLCFACGRFECFLPLAIRGSFNASGSAQN